MNEIESELATFLKGGVRTPPVEVSAEKAMEDSHGRAHRAISVGAAISTVVVVAAVVAVSRYGGADVSGSSDESGNTQKDVVATVGRYIFTYPSEWQYVPSDDKTQGGTDKIAYFTNESPTAQCSMVVAGPNSTLEKCLAPVPVLSKGGILVTVTAGSLDARNFRPNTTVAGYPAQVSDPDSDISGCPPGTSERISANVADNSSYSSNPQLRIDACLAVPLGTRPDEVAQFLDNLHIR